MAPKKKPAAKKKPTAAPSKPRTVVAKPKPMMKKKKMATPKQQKAAAVKTIKDSGYKVPKKLLTKSKMTMGVREGQKLTPAEKAAYKKGVAELHKQAQASLRAKPAPKKKGIKKPISDWDKGMGVAKNISIANALAKRNAR